MDEPEVSDQKKTDEKFFHFVLDKAFPLTIQQSH